MDDLEDDSGLPPEQALAARLLVDGKPLADICGQVSVSRTTLFRWRQTELFKLYYKALRQRMAEETERSIIALVPLAIEAWKRCLERPGSIASMKCAELILRDYSDLYFEGGTHAETNTTQPFPQGDANGG